MASETIGRVDDFSVFLLGRLGGKSIIGGRRGGSAILSEMKNKKTRLVLVLVLVVQLLPICHNRRVKCVECKKVDHSKLWLSRSTPIYIYPLSCAVK